MNELSERAKKIAAEMRDYACFTQEIADSLNGKLGWISEAIGRDPSKHQTYESLIEQALLAERRLAYESIAEMIESAAMIRPNHEIDGFNIAAGLRAAAEKEVGTK